jgi:hypothetical protein
MSDEEPFNFADQEDWFRSNGLDDLADAAHAERLEGFKKTYKAGPSVLFLALYCEQAIADKEMATIIATFVREKGASRASEVAGLLNAQEREITIRNLLLEGKTKEEAFAAIAETFGSSEAYVKRKHYELQKKLSKR